MLWWSDAGLNILGSAIPVEERSAQMRDLLRLAMTNEAFRRRLRSRPADVLGRRLGLQFGAGRTLRIVENTGRDLYVVLPRRMTVSDFDTVFPEHELSDEDLRSASGVFNVAFKDNFDVHWVGDQNDKGDSRRIQPPPDRTDWGGGDWHKEAVDKNRFDSAPNPSA